MISFEIRNRWTNEVQVTAQIDCAPDAPVSIKLGLAVRWAVKEKANLSGANLREAYLSEVRTSVAHRLQQLMRPLDVLASLDERHFAVAAMLEDLQECSPSSFKRLHEGLNLKAFKTSEGFITLKAGIALVGLDAKALPVKPETLLEHARRRLPEAYNSGRVTAERLTGSA